MSSATGGYLLPTQTPLPGGLTLTQYLQSVLVGISGLSGSLCRPEWQLNPPKQPNAEIDWMSFGIYDTIPNANAFTDLNSDEDYVSSRHVELVLRCSFYGPLGSLYASIVMNGFQIVQNLDALLAANMGYVSTGDMVSVPELINERWVNKIVMEVRLRREIIVTYDVLSLLQAKGTITAENPGNTLITQPWETPLLEEN